MWSTLIPHSTNKAEIRKVAESILSGEMDLLEGIRSLSGFLPHDFGIPAVKLIVVRESETDHLPGRDQRHHCSAEYLARVDAEIKKFEIECRDEIEEACREILKLFS